MFIKRCWRVEIPMTLPSGSAQKACSVTATEILGTICGVRDSVWGVQPYFKELLVQCQVQPGLCQKVIFAYNGYKDRK